MIEDVVEVRPNGKVSMLRDLEALQQIQIGVEVVRTTEDVAASVGEPSLSHVEADWELSCSIQTRNNRASRIDLRMAARGWASTVPLRGKPEGYAQGVPKDQGW